MKCQPFALGLIAIFTALSAQARVTQLPKDIPWLAADAGERITQVYLIDWEESAYHADRGARAACAIASQNLIGVFAGSAPKTEYTFPDMMKMSDGGVGYFADLRQHVKLTRAQEARRQLVLKQFLDANSSEDEMKADYERIQFLAEIFVEQKELEVSKLFAKLDGDFSVLMRDTILCHVAISQQQLYAGLLQNGKQTLARIRGYIKSSQNLR